MVIIRRHSKKYNFVGNTKTGFTFRWGESIKDDPIRAPFPELVDISISNHCSNGCNFCYRESASNHTFMSLADYKFIIKSLVDPKWGTVFQVALGGGEPLEHPKFIEILEITKQNKIVPNFTTNGFHLTKAIVNQIKPLIGTLALSFSDINNISSSNAYHLLNEGIKPNIHFILNKHSIKQGIEILEGMYNSLLKDFNSIIFLTYKPAGRATNDLCLSLTKELDRFCRLIDDNNCLLNIGFDSCFVPILMHYTNTNIEYIDPCECAFFSAYIDENLNVKPCSFANNNRDTYSLREFKFSEIWNKYWESYRNAQNNICQRECKNTSNCRGGCPFYDQINLCKSVKSVQSLV
jgi:radical SAM protein with 4Fe4S-binding SPASM domain